MADNFADKQRAANMRLLQAMSGGGMQRPQPAPVPNYSAIPMNIAEMDAAMPTMAPPGVFNKVSPAAMPMAPGGEPMPPQQAPSPAAMPSMPPVNVQAPAPAPDTYADLGGYGGQPRMQSPQEMYGHLNPTPSLEEVFRREYAANPAAFGKLFG